MLNTSAWPSSGNSDLKQVSLQVVRLVANGRADVAVGLRAREVGERV
jgi:hypothetical protein